MPKHRNKRRQQDPKATPTTSIQQNHNSQQVSEVTEPQNDFQRLQYKPEVIGQAYQKHETLKGNETSRQSITENGLACKREPQWLGVKCLKDKLLIAASPDGRLFLFDPSSSEVEWSISTGDALHVSYHIAESNLSYIVFGGGSRRAYMRTNGSKPVYLGCNAREFVAEPYKYLEGDFISSISVTKIYVNLRTGRKLNEATTDSSSDEILLITRFDYQLTIFQPGTRNVLSYQRIASFDISIVSKDAPARMGVTLIKPGTTGKISWSDRVVGKGGNDTVLIEGEYQQRAVIVRIAKGKSGDDAVKKKVSIVSDVCDANRNFAKVCGMESDPNFSYVATEHCGTSLRSFIQSFHNPGNQHLKDYNKLWKLIREIVTALAWLDCKGISHGNLNLDSIFVNKYYRPKISVISLSKDATDDMLRHDMLTLGHVIFFCLVGVEYKHENLNSLKPQNHLKPIYDCPHALDLLKKLLDKEPVTRATALEARNHTIFWSSRKKLRFIRAVTERLELKGPKLLAAINAINAAVFGQSWDTYLPTQFLDVMKDGGYSNHVYRYDSTYDLLCIIRHLKTHETRIRHLLSLNKVLHPEVQEMFGTAGFESYYRKKFPNLVNEAYNAMKDHIGKEASFLEFYKKTHCNFKVLYLIFQKNNRL